MSINVANARRLIKILKDEDNPVDFNMQSWFVHNEEGLEDPRVICDIVKKHPCGTVACLAGHAALEAWRSGDEEITYCSTVRTTAERWLGLNDCESADLFHGHWGDEPIRGPMEDLTKEQAIIELNRLIDVKLVREVLER